MHKAHDFDYDFSLMPHYMERFMSRMRIAVIYGGSKEKEGAVMYETHNPRSWKSYMTVAENIKTSLEELGFRHVWLMPDDMTMQENLKENGIHFAWLNTGGVQGYESMCHAAGFLEMMGVPYVGHSPLNSCRLDSKHVFKREISFFPGILTPDFMTWFYLEGMLPVKYNREFALIFGEYEGPFVVKPVSGRASLHVHVADSKKDLPQLVNEISELTRNYVLIEKYMPGREFCVAVAGCVTYAKGVFTKRDAPFAFSEVERVLGKEERIFTSMDKKAITRDRIRLVSPEDELKKELEHLGQRIYRGFDMKSIVRLDLRADENGHLNVLEVNPKPDLKKPETDVISIATMGLAEHDMTYNDLILSLLADRLDYLMTYRASSIRHIWELLKR